MNAPFKPRTVVEAIEESAHSNTTGFRFIDENSTAEPFFSHGGIERASARGSAIARAASPSPPSVPSSSATRRNSA